MTVTTRSRAWALLCAGAGLLAAATAEAVSLDFSTLPSAQGWTYQTFNAGPPETDAFVVDGTTLFSHGTSYSGGSYYELTGAFDPLLPPVFVMEVEARVTQSSGNDFGLGFLVQVPGAESMGFGLGTHRVAMQGTMQGQVTLAYDNTQFHTYRFEAQAAGAYRLLIDNVEVTAGTYGVNPAVGFNRILFGDITAGASAEAELRKFVFLQNRPPDVQQAAPSIAEIWPPNGKMVDVTIGGVTDPEGNGVTLEITGIHNDETADADAEILGPTTAALRAPRSGQGPGRTYVVTFIATDEHGASTTGTVEVVVPHDRRNASGRSRAGKPAALATSAWGTLKRSVAP